MVLDIALPLPMKRRSFFSVLTAVVVTCLLISLAGGGWLLAHSPLALLRGAPEPIPTAAMFVPKQAPLMAALLVNPDRVLALRQLLAHPGDRRQTRIELQQFQQGLLADADLNYEKDIKPWLGDELTLAVTTLDIDRDQSNGSAPGYLLAVKTKDAERAREFLQLFWQKQAIAGTDLQFEQYQGAQLISGQLPVGQREGQEASLPIASATTSLATAVVGRQFVLFANSPKVLRNAINTVQVRELGLVSDRGYQRALGSLMADRIGLAFVNLPQLVAWTERSPQSTAQTNGAQTDGAQMPYESVAVAWGLDRQGIVAETALVTAPGPALPDANGSLSQPVSSLKYIPATSPVVAAGHDLAELWASINRGLEGYGLAQVIRKPLQNWQQRWQLDLVQDIFAWVKGEYALGLIPTPAAPPDWVFVVNRADSPDAATAIAHLNDIAKQQGLTTIELPLQDHTVSAWTRLSAAAPGKTTDLALQANVAAVHASLGDYELFTNSVAAMDQVLQAKSLADTATFDQAIAPLLTPNNGYFYVDWPQGKTLLESRLPLVQVLELAGQPVFSHLRSLSLSSYGNQAGIQRGGLFIRLS
jgi:Protein of unknown function (DUF3352)